MSCIVAFFRTEGILLFAHEYLKLEPDGIHFEKLTDDSSSFQFYLEDARDRLERDLLACQTNHCIFAAKVWQRRLHKGSGCIQTSYVVFSR